MRIGFDISQTGSHRAGCGTVADRLLHALLERSDANEREFVLYPTFGDRYFDPGGVDAIAIPAAPGVIRGPVHRSAIEAREFWGEPQAAFESELGKPDVVHAHNFFCPAGLDHARLVYTLHDLSFLEHPEWTTEANRQVCWRGVFGAAQRADAIVAVSAATRRDFLAHFPHYPEDRVTVMPLASRFAEEEDSVSTECPRSLTRSSVGRLGSGEFLLTVATLEPRKNPIGLLRAYAAYRQRSERPFPLVWAGARGWLCDAFDAELETLGLDRHVLRPGFVDDDALRWLYAQCAVFVYPSLFEGFGLPVVEAMAHGAPVVTSTSTSLPEVAGDAALLVAPDDIEALAAALVRVQDPTVANSFREAGRLQAQKFSWARTADVALEVYRQAIARPRFASGV